MELRLPLDRICSILIFNFGLLGNKDNLSQMWPGSENYDVPILCQINLMFTVTNSVFVMAGSINV